MLLRRHHKAALAPTAPVDPSQYEGLGKAALQAELVARGLPKSGNVAALVARLDADDATGTPPDEVPVPHFDGQTIPVPEGDGDAQSGDVDTEGDESGDNGDEPDNAEGDADPEG